MSKPEAIPSVRISAEVTRQIRQHARTSMSTEVCGVLIGDTPADGPENAVEIFAAIAGINAAQAGTHVTFTQDAWEHIYKVKDVEYPDARIVGWYHSHPGFGVFLSEHDTFIQENFFSAASQVAWVFDPHTDEEGCFGWVESRITRLTSIAVVDRDVPAKVSESRELAPVSETEEGEVVRSSASPRWQRWMVTVSLLLVAAAAGFAASHFLLPSVYPYPLVVPINPLTQQALLHDSKTGNPVYMDPQAKRYVVVDPRSHKLVPIDVSEIKTDLPMGTGGSLPPPAAAPSPAAPQEKR